MSIHPLYAGLILSGSKRVEFRRTRLRASVSHVLIYETAPVQRVTGFFEVDAVIEAAPQSIWRRFAPVAGIDHTAFSSYFAGRRIATAIQVGRVVSLSRHISLASFERRPVVPQSFRYVSTTWLERISGRGI
jgi:predicted transcriptional regulator